MLDKDILEGCKNSSELLARMLEHFGLDNLPLEMAFPVLISRLSMEKYGVDSYIEAINKLTQEILPESADFFAKPSKPENLLLRAAEIAILELAQEAEGCSLRDAGEYLSTEHELPKRLRSKHSENKSNPDIRLLADELIALSRDSQLPIEKLIESYLSRK